MTKKNYLNIIFLIASIIVAFSLSIYKRNWQLKKWKEKPEFYFANNYLPAMSTLDAYYWLRYARDEITGDSKKIKKDLRRFPDRLKYPHPVPIFSRILSKFYKFFPSDEFDQLYVGSIKFCNILAGLFIIPLIIYIYLSGGYLSGFLASLIGTFSAAYYVRSSTGRVDTDGILMFAPFFVSLLFLLIIKSKKDWIKYSITIIIAIFFYLFSKIHIAIQAAMILYFIIFSIALIIHKEKLINKLLLPVLYILICNPLNFFHSIKRILFFLNSSYFLKTNSIMSIQKTIETVAEAQHFSLDFAIRNVFNNEIIFLLGLSGCIWFFIKKFKDSIFIIPIFIIGIYGLFGSIRFTMFLGIFIGLGIGFILTEIIKYLLKIFNKYNLFKLNVISLSLMLIFFIIFKNFTGYNFIPVPHCPIPIVEDIIKLKKQLPKNSVFFTWWDLGYTYEDIGRFITFIDGGIEDLERRFSVATAFLSDNDTKLHNLITFVSNNGFSEIRKIIYSKDKKKLQKIFKYNKKIKYKNIYLVYTVDLLQKADVFDNYAFLTNYESQDFHFYQLPCFQLTEDNVICNNFKIDLNTGYIVGFKKVPVDKIIISKNGKITKSFVYKNHHTGKVIEILISKEIFNVRYISNDVFNTVFNKMFLLGIYNKKYFEEVFNHFPHIRVFKVK